MPESFARGSPRSSRTCRAAPELRLDERPVELAERLEGFRPCERIQGAHAVMEEEVEDLEQSVELELLRQPKRDGAEGELLVERRVRGRREHRRERVLLARDELVDPLLVAALLVAGSDGGREAAHGLQAVEEARLPVQGKLLRRLASCGGVGRRQWQAGPIAWRGARVRACQVALDGRAA